MSVDARPLVEHFKEGLDAPICITWELTYACNLACVHCLSSSGRRDPKELSFNELVGVVDELAAMKVFYVNIGGGEPMIRSDFMDLLDVCLDRGVGVKFSTNGSRLDAAKAARIAASDYLDVQISLDGADAVTNDVIRGEGTFDTAVAAMDRLAEAGMEGFKISVVATKASMHQLDDFYALAERYRAQLRLTRLRPSGRAVDVWDELHPSQADQRTLYRWLLDHPMVLTGDSFFHLNALGSQKLDGLNLCGAGRVVCLIDPVGDVYACPFAIHEQFLAGNVRDPGGFTGVWQGSELFASLREPGSAGACTSCGSYDACQGGCMAAKLFTGMDLEGPDPECVHGHAPEQPATPVALRPRPAVDHSRLIAARP